MEVICFITHESQEITNSWNMGISGFGKAGYNNNNIKFELINDGKHAIYFNHVNFYVNNPWEISNSIVIAMNNKFHDAEIIYFIHHSDDLNEIRKRLGFSVKDINVYKYSSTYPEPWNTLIEIKRQCPNGTCEERNLNEVISLFTRIWDYCHGIHKIHDLRYNILEPFVALNLMEQADISAPFLKEDIINRLKRITETIVIELCQRLKIDPKNQLYQTILNEFNQLKSSIASGCDKIDFYKLKVFSNTLENAIANFEGAL